LNPACRKGPSKKHLAEEEVTSGVTPVGIEDMADKKVDLDYKNNECLEDVKQEITTLS
jgi:hypothetical protein